MLVKHWINIQLDAKLLYVIRLLL